MRISKKDRLTKEDIKDIILMYQDGLKLTEISEKYRQGQSTINGIICYHNNRKNKVYSILSLYYKTIIDELRDNYKTEPKKTIQRYEVKILFGLITLKFEPIIN